jgi:primosomal protein N' (replication factor Y)
VAEKAANLVASNAERLGKKLSVDVVGPAPAVLAKIQNKYRWHIILKAKKTQELQQLLSHLLGHFKGKLDPKVVLQVDVDPVSLM